MEIQEVQQELEERISSEEMIAVVLKASNKLIGNVYLGKRNFNSLELGYVFNKQYWGQGYAKESCDAVIKKAFSEGIHRIYAECTLVTQLPGDYWKAQALQKKLIFDKMCTFGRTRAAPPYGRIPLCIYF